MTYYLPTPYAVYELVEDISKMKPDHGKCYLIATVKRVIWVRKEGYWSNEKPGGRVSLWPKHACPSLELAASALQQKFDQNCKHHEQEIKKHQESIIQSQVYIAKVEKRLEDARTWDAKELLLPKESYVSPFTQENK